MTAALPAEERASAAPKSTTPRQAAAFAKTRLAPPASRPPEKPASTPQIELILKREMEGLLYEGLKTHGSKPLLDTKFQRFLGGESVFSTENVKSKNFMLCEWKEEKFLNASVR